MKTDMFLAVMNAILATASRSLKKSGLQRFSPVTSHNQIFNQFSICLLTFNAKSSMQRELSFSGDVVVAAVFVVTP